MRKYKNDMEIMFKNSELVLYFTPLELMPTAFIVRFNAEIIPGGLLESLLFETDQYKCDITFIPAGNVDINSIGSLSKIIKENDKITPIITTVILPKLERSKAIDVKT